MTNYRKDIDALRGIAVLIVILFHIFPKVASSGFVGVDVFFVISGYLITGILLNANKQEQFSLLKFYDRRIRRIFPSLIFVLITALLLGYLVLYSEELTSLAKHIYKSSIFLQNLQLINEAGYFDALNSHKPLLHLWSLSVEEQFYVVWPIFVFFIYKFGKKGLWILVSLTCFSLFFSIVYFQQDKVFTYYNIIPRFWQLAIGGILSYSYHLKYLSNKCSNTLFFIIGVVVILLSGYCLDKDKYPSYYALLPTLGAALYIMSNTKYKHYLGLDKIGLISYPLYLWHWLLFSFLIIYTGDNITLFMKLTTILFSFILSCFSYLYVERIRYSTYKYTSVFLLIFMGFTFIVSYYFYSQKGLPNRSWIQQANNLEQFKRSQHIDSITEKYLKRNLNTTPLFYYRRGFDLGKDKIIAIIGDSHAHVMFEGVKKIAKEKGYGVILLASSSCPTLLGFTEGNNPQMVVECEIQKKQIMSILSSEKRIVKVIMTTRGPTYVNGDVKGKMTISNIDKTATKVYKYAKDRYSNPKDIYSDYFNGYQNTLKFLSKISHIKSIYYMLENPELDFYPKDALRRPFDFWGISSKHKNISKKAYLHRMKTYRKEIIRISKKYKAKILDPLNYMCPRNDCIYFYKRSFLYADDDHLSKFGSVWLVDKFKNKIFVEH